MAALLALDDASLPEALAAGGDVLVDFWAPWCGPCQALAPTLEALAGEFAGRVAFAKVDVDAAPASAARFGIRSIPSLVLFRDGERVDTRLGQRPREELRAWLDARLA